MSSESTPKPIPAPASPSAVTPAADAYATPGIPSRLLDDYDLEMGTIKPPVPAPTPEPQATPAPVSAVPSADAPLELGTLDEPRVEVAGPLDADRLLSASPDGQSLNN